MRIRYDFVAPEGVHFGVMQSLDDAIAAITNAVDIWTADLSAMTITDSKISAWAGRNGRSLAQSVAASRPVWTGNGPRFFNTDTNLPNAYLSLAGTQVGAQNKLTVASKIKLSPAVLLTDLHYIWGWASPINRVMYRYVNGGKLIRLQCGTTNIDVPLPTANTGEIGVVAVYDFPAGGTSGTATLHVAGVGSASGAITAVPELQGFTLGGAGGASPADMPGWATKAGLWTQAVSGDALNDLLAWVA